EFDLLKARIIKIDIEGAEWHLLKALKPFIPLLASNAEIVLEAVDQYLISSNGSLNEIIALLGEDGFEPWLFENEYSPKWYATYRPRQPVPLGSKRLRQADLLFRRSVVQT